MQRNEFLWSLPVTALALSGCSTVSGTGRRQLSLIPSSVMIGQSAAAYSDVMSKGPLSTNQQQVAQVKRVGQRISNAVTRHLQATGEAHKLEGFTWEFNLIEDSTPNAWCMPGGKVMFYTGILPFTQDDAGLAVVMGHEIAHAVAGHGRERASHRLLQQGGSLVASYLSRDSQYREAIMQVYGIGSQVGAVLPYSRLHEYEADKLGAIYMAMAGYDPRAAIGFWQRMAAAAKQKPLAFFSTHPSDAKRIQKLKECMPEALQFYKG